MKKLRTGDEVIVISGKDIGKTGTLSKFISETKCIVSGVKIVKKHQKPNPQLNICLLYTSPSPRDATLSRMPSSA